MAGLGMTKLDAVNEMLEAVGEMPVPAVDSTGTWPALVYGTSEAGRAEQILDRESRRYQTRGWEDNTDVCRFFALNAATNTKLDLSASPFLTDRIVFVRAAGPQHYLNVSIRNGIVWNNQTNTDVLTGVATTVGGVVGVYLDAIRWLDFDQVTPRLKDAIVAHTKLIYQRRTRQNAEQDVYLSQESTVANVMTAPVATKKDGVALSPWPINPQPLTQQTRQGQ